MANQQNRASWSSATTQLFLQLLVEEKNAGNWSGKSATKKGYENVGNMLCRRTGIDYNKAQMKSKFDGLRSLFHLWTNMFNGQTGAGYEYATGNLTMSDSWWETKIRENDMYKKFKKSGLENADLMYSVFGDSSATGMYQYTPTTISPNIGNHSGYDETSGGYISPTRTPRLDEDVSSPPRSAEGSGHTRLSGGKRKLSSDEAWSNSLDSLTKTISESVGPREYVHKLVQVDGDTEILGKALEVLYKLPGLDPDSELFFLGAELIEDKYKRTIFMGLHSDEARMRWLKRHNK